MAVILDLGKASGDFRGLEVCHSRHIPRPILKISLLLTISGLWPPLFPPPSPLFIVYPLILVLHAFRLAAMFKGDNIILANISRYGEQRQSALVIYRVRERVGVTLSRIGHQEESSTEHQEK